MAPVETDRRLRTTFDDVANVYDEARPGYPEQLIEDVIALSEIGPGGRILEIGCGSGQATLPFARRGYAMTCLELGENLAALAAEHCRPYSNVEVVPISFEAWRLQAKRFDLVLSASAFDWIPPEIGYPKAAAALREGGSLALFWHDHLGGETAFFREAMELRRRTAAQLADEATVLSPGARLQAIEEEIRASALFGPVTVKRYPWAAEYTAEGYVKLLSTYSAVRSLARETRRTFLDGIGELVEQYGGVVQTRYLTFLCLARTGR